MAIVDAHCLGTLDPVSKEHLGGKAPQTRDIYRAAVKRWLVSLRALGHDLDRANGLAALITPDLVVPVAKHWIAIEGQPGGITKRTAAQYAMFIRTLVRADPDRFDIEVASMLDEILSNNPHFREGRAASKSMTPEAVEFCRDLVRNKDIRRTFYRMSITLRSLAEDILARADAEGRSLTKTERAEARKLGAMAAVVAIETTGAPLRLNNVRTLAHLGPNQTLFLPSGERSHATIKIPVTEMKGEAQKKKQLPPIEIVADERQGLQTLQWYLEKIRPLFPTHTNSFYLFPAIRGVGPLCQQLFHQWILEASTAADLTMNMHRFRHALATLLLWKKPGAERLAAAPARHHGHYGAPPLRVARRGADDEGRAERDGKDSQGGDGVVTARAHILAKPAFQPLIGHPALDALPLANLRVLDSFFDFLVARGKGAPSAGDAAAWAAIERIDDEDLLETLIDALGALAPSHSVLHSLRDAATGARHRANFRGQAPKSRRRRYVRTVSVDPSALPEDWMALLRAMGMGLSGKIKAPAPDIVVRLEQKLCQFAWSAKKAGLPVELRLRQLQAYYEDLEGRRLRAATRRASWEELHRFARYIGDKQAVALLAPTLSILRIAEQGETPLKFKALLEAGTTLTVLRKARKRLKKASASPLPDRRHSGRNRAAAFALGAIAPLRREWHRIVFGDTLTWSAEEGYRITLVPQKTSEINPTPYCPQIHEDFAVFIDALILQDHDPAYLGDLRDMVIKRRRPLFVTYDGLPCAQSTVSRYWAEEIGTGAHIARTMIHDHSVDLALAGRLGEGEAFDPVSLGVRLGMAFCHQTAARTAVKYESEQTHKVELRAAQGCVSAIAKDEGFFD